MAYIIKLASRIRKQLLNIPTITEKEMMGGLVFMVDQKLCIGIMKDKMICRIDPDFHDIAIERTGCGIRYTFT